MLFYSLPHYPQFYVEFLNMLPDLDNSCQVLYTKFDVYELERIVGTKRCERMLQSSKTTHMLM
jgi:U3 small nucleolar RNA-associated protein 25